VQSVTTYATLQAAQVGMKKFERKTAGVTVQRMFTAVFPVLRPYITHYELQDPVVVPVTISTPTESLTAQTPIAQLYTTGPHLSFPGLHGALSSAVTTTHSVLGYTGVLELLSGRTVLEDLAHVDAFMEYAREQKLDLRKQQQQQKKKKKTNNNNNNKKTQ
jgi:hypothetical protein